MNMHIKQISLTVIVSLFSVSFLFAQPLKKYQFVLHARIIDRDNVPVSDAPLKLEGTDLNNSATTDQDGRFTISLPAGKYRITGDKSANLNAFIEIAENGINPTNFDLVINTNQEWCTLCPDGKNPEVIHYVVPEYPEEANKIGASGKVVVDVTFDKDGRVISAKSISGHPLMRKSCAEAIRQWTFSPSENASERKGKIIFNFTDTSDEGVKFRFRKPNLMDVYISFPTIITVN